MGEQQVAIPWRRDVEQGLADAQRQQRNALLDFSAAPL
jgi:hypothetical protein